MYGVREGLDEACDFAASRGDDVPDLSSARISSGGSILGKLDRGEVRMTAHEGRIDSIDDESEEDAFFVTVTTPAGHSREFALDKGRAEFHVGRHAIVRLIDAPHGGRTVVWLIEFWLT